jgi:hypothetical protein
MAFYEIYDGAIYLYQVNLPTCHLQDQKVAVQEALRTHFITALATSH